MPSGRTQGRHGRRERASCGTLCPVPLHRGTSAFLCVLAVSLPVFPSHARESPCIDIDSVSDRREGGEGDEHASQAPQAGREPLTIGRISVRPGELFDPARPGEGRWFHGMANALHFATREATVLAALPFTSGDRFSDSRLEEGERALRTRRFLRDATVVPVRRCGDVADVDVHTIDNWTLTPSIAFGSAGGVERYSVEVQDMNVLGLGKELLFRASRSGKEHESRFVYGDDNVLGGPHRLRLEVGDTEDGERYEVSAGLPFRTASSSASWWLSALSETDSFKLAPDAPQVSTVDTLSAAALVDTERFDLGVAAALSRSTFDVARAGAGFRIERQITRLPVGLDEAAKRTDFEEAYPYLQASWAQRKWTERSNYPGIGRIEDIDTGIGVHIEAGLLLEALGNVRDQLRFSAELAKAWHVGEDALHRLTLGGTRYVGAATDPNAPPRASRRVHPLSVLSLAW